ncbi:3223_t:CDS:2, partial [Entrophospora sp. SA101]
KNENHQVTSEKSATDATQKYLKEIDKKTTIMSGVLLFGFLPFEEVKDTTHRSHLKVFGKNILDDFNESSDNILNSNSSELIGIALKINDQLYYLCFKEDDDGKKLYAEAVVQQLDQHNILQSEGRYTLDDNVHIRISGNGRNVVLYSGIEKYEYLQKALHQLIEELDDIDKNGFIDSIGQKWRITIYFS